MFQNISKSYLCVILSLCTLFVDVRSRMLYGTFSICMKVTIYPKRRT